jgi:transposase
MKEFYIEDLNKALAGHEYGLSIRHIAKDLGIPKSSVGRWVQDPDYYRQSMQFKSVGKEMRDVPEHMIKRQTKLGPQSDYDKYRRFKEKILKNPIGRQRELNVTYNDETGKWTVQS